MAMQKVLMILTLVASSFPATAQDATQPRIIQSIVYGNDPCPSTEDGTIAVCVRKNEDERYRIPEPLRLKESPANEARAVQIAAYERLGRAGASICEPVGPNGWTGCSGQLLDQADSTNQVGVTAEFSNLIANEREKKLANINAEADAAQTIVVPPDEKTPDQRRKHPRSR